MVHQEIRAVLFWRDRIVLAFTYYFNVFNLNFISEMRARVFMNRSDHVHARFLLKFLCKLKRFFRNIALYNDSLKISRSVTKLQKGNLAA